MLVGLLGDLHGAFDALDRAMAREPNAGSWLSVGDIGSDDGMYPAPSRPFYFIKGNNEDFDVIARLAAGQTVSPHLHLLPNGTAVDVAEVRVAGLGGTFAPKWYDTPPQDLPASLRKIGRARDGKEVSRRSGGAAKADDKRRHFVRAEVDACMTLRGIDLFLSHEAPRPYWVGEGRRRNDAGKTVINKVLAAPRPRLSPLGHHHRFTEGVCEGVPSIGLPLVTDGYLVLDTERWTWELRALAAD
jgi:uncharacterized protein